MEELVLGIESSCDDTSAAVVAGGHRVLANVTASQVEVHQRFGGVVPEVASRRHLESLLPVVDTALAQAGVGLRDLAAVAVTMGPGLVGSLLVGVSAAKALAWGAGLDLIGVNHLEGHIYANFLAYPGLEPPLVCLVVSGGHTELYHLEERGRYRLLGRTRDDAAGEAIDKLARVMGLGYPGGPPLEALANKGDPQAIPFPRPLAGEETLDFSFSGLKTAALHQWEKSADHSPQFLADLAASFQETIVEVLVENLVKAAELARTKRVALAGGVAANGRLREKLLTQGSQKGLEVYLPPPLYCTDNAAMIAAAGYHRWRRGERSGWELNAYPDLALPGCGESG